MKIGQKIRVTKLTPADEKYTILQVGDKGVIVNIIEGVFFVFFGKPMYKEAPVYEQTAIIPLPSDQLELVEY